MKGENKKVSSSPKLRRGVLAYIDFLGTKEIIKKSEDSDNKMLTDILEIYNKALEELETKPNVAMFKLQTKIFSDNIVICADISKSSDEGEVYAIGNLIAFVGFFQAISLEKGYKTRGSVTIGSYYLNETLIWGSALVDAVMLEEKEAKMPCVIISDELSKEIERVTSITGVEISSLNFDFKSPFIDFSWYFKNKTGILEYIIQSIDQEIEAVEDNAKVKLQWLSQYLAKSID